jgi:hypothetical protein
VNGDRRPVRRQAALVALRWGMAAIVVAAIHFTAAWGALSWRNAEATADAQPPAVMIDLARSRLLRQRRRKRSRQGRR